MQNYSSIPELVKRQAILAVGHLETTAMIRRMTARYAAASPVDHTEAPSYQSLNSNLKQKALEAVSHPEVRKHVRLLEDTDHIRPPHVPSLRARPMGTQIDGMYRSGLSPNAVHSLITKDDFKKEPCLTL